MEEVSDLEEQLASVSSEIQALGLQIQELLERQQLLVEKEQVLKKKIESLSADDGAGSSATPAMSVEDWNKRDFPWSQKVDETLKSVFKLQTFRPLQLQAINVTMSEKDIFLIMPTGGGKSLCYELPAVCSSGFTLVICPLISLMEDQLMVLEQLGIASTMLNSNSTREHIKWVHDEMLNKSSKLKLLYVTPEKIAKSKAFMSKLEKAYNAGCLTRIAVDEVHCCSQWGHDFRPDYKSLGILKRQFPKTPLIGLTATATSNILEDVKKILCIPKCLMFTASFNRPNLFYEIRQKPTSFEACIEDIVRMINGRYKGKSGIIYCLSQKDTEQVTCSLQKLGIAAGCYHANMEAAAKTKVHKDWTLNKIKIVVATVAFGMGIDKADVRFVIHQTVSKSMENYYQESGRAGRDDLKADCVLYYGFMDIFRQSTMVVMENVGQQKLYEMVAYCQDSQRCRRVQIAQYFDEVWDSTKCNKMCDNCNSETSYEKVDVTSYCADLIKILKQAEQLGEKLTPLKLIEAWNGKGPSKLRVASVSPPNLSRSEMEELIVHLLLEQYLKEEFSFTAFATIAYLKEAPRANLLNNKKHVISMRMKLRSNKLDSSAEEVPEKVTSAQQKETGNKRKPTSTAGKVTPNKKSKVPEDNPFILD
ncbi:ATP-dependent DNA helicase Q1 [Chiloscyllium plagiosum]|uniref:ATP-dependent DNA helicase Q1 n=1 Tax=Chiloscyllium plagiosum TaxID=36176 RepID=UPI001CB7B2A3|nr:ATP-dependent DNA helicase Q1 [Chiloscyllium plagiosum]XP_043569370.1 ATP-dependent DNA helicase Q1 [Chiloscyllium plagiosum]XP_043569371.1 ATP-dependent DNA helicase Q1 [Chiloscyllium plagiosum]XP_043569372.1 ATP-dependent DNA helicase Q1 [Chiloscyllium plagiosum]